MQNSLLEAAEASKPSRPSARLLHLVDGCELLTGCLICGMAVFSPWAFGTTQTWSIRSMNAAGYGLGILWLARRALQGKRLRYSERSESVSGISTHEKAEAILIGLLLAYVLVSAANARTTFMRTGNYFVYHQNIAWLPASMDATATWNVFLNLLALAASFWAIRGWMQGGEHRVSTLLCLLACNGAALSVEGILQRLESSGTLLFLVRPRENPLAEAQFGPWAYRGSAASYFNLLWPACLGFWASLDKERMSNLKPALLLICSGLMATAPPISGSRGGALINTALLVLSTGYLVWRSIRKGRGSIRLPAIFLLMVMLVGGGLGATSLFPRLADSAAGFMLREELNRAAAPMRADYPLFGTGPGSFETVSQHYRPSPESAWLAQLHNDWLETLITFGWTGTALIIALLTTVLGRHFRTARSGDNPRSTLLLLGLAGTLIHARWDFPFQIYSVGFLFVLLCAVPAERVQERGQAQAIAAH